MSWGFWGHGYCVHMQFWNKMLLVYQWCNNAWLSFGWEHVSLFIVCALRSVHGALTRWTLLAPSVGWGWQVLVCSAQSCVASRMGPSSLGFAKAEGVWHTHWHVLYDPPDSNVLKILKIASKELLLSDGKTDVLVTCAALSQKNRDKWSYLPKLKKWGCFVSFCVVRFSGGVLSGFFFCFGLAFLICLRFFGFWSGVFCLLIKRTEPLCCTITLGQSFLITEAPIPVKHFTST